MKWDKTWGEVGQMRLSGFVERTVLDSIAAVPEVPRHVQTRGGDLYTFGVARATPASKSATPVHASATPNLGNGQLLAKEGPLPALQGDLST